MLAKPQPELATPSARGTIPALLLVCLAALALRVYVGWWLGFLGDLTAFQVWALNPDEIVRWGTWPILAENYPPLYLSILRLLRWTHGALQLPGDFGAPIALTESIAEQRPLILLLKTPSIIADVISALLIHALGRHLRRPWLGVGLAAFYLFSPAILYDGAYFGQTDTILLTFLFAAVLAFIRGKPVLLGAMLVAAMLMKVQAFFVVMILSLAILGQWRAVWRGHLMRLIAGGAGALACVAALAAVTGKLVAFKTGYVGVVGLFPRVTINAFNLWWLLLRPWDKPPRLSDFPHDTVAVFGGLTYRSVGMILFFTAMGLIFWLLHRRRYTPYALMLACAAAGWAFFNLLTEMHERYSVVAVGFMCLLPFWRRRWLLYALLASVTATLNIVTVAYFHFPPSRTLTHIVNWIIWPDQQLVWTVIAGLHVAMLPLLVEALWRDHSDAARTAAAFPVVAPNKVKPTEHTGI